MSRKPGKNRALVVLLTLMLACTATGCPDNDLSSEEKAASLRDKPKTFAANNNNLPKDELVNELPPGLLILYNKLNMRSFPSSFGPRLKHYCESYLFEYFPRDGVQVNSPTRMTLESSDDTWIIEQSSTGRIRVRTMIGGSGSYDSDNEYNVHLLAATNDMRSDALWIKQKTTCTPLHPDRPTVLGLRDHRTGESEPGQVCGDFWSGSSVTPEYEHWKTLDKLPRELKPNQPAWEAADMLLIDVTDHLSLNQRCPSNTQMRDVLKTPVYAQADGAQNGVLTIITTYAHHLLEMAGFIRFSTGHEQKTDFDLIAKEQLVLLFAEENNNWLNISNPNQQNAWIKTTVFDTALYTTKILHHADRVLSADEINLMDSITRVVHREASGDSEVLHTLRDSRTAMSPLAIEGDWLKVKFVPPPDYPLIECGDSAEDFEWIEGWIKWQENDTWFVSEEHHYGC